MKWLALVFVTGCAIAHVQPDGIRAASLGNARVVICESGRASSSPDGSFVTGPCLVVQGGTLSGSFVDALAVLGQIVAAYFTAGTVW